MRLKNLEISGFKSFSSKINLEFQNSIVCIVGPNGSGKSNIVEALRFVLGEQSMKSMRGKIGFDLIFKGSKNLPKSSRAYVSIYFDNSDKIFKLSNGAGGDLNLNHDLITISREVYPDGLNKYILNGREVRLKDINNLLSSIKIGSSGYHIISQGEADRILNANPKECQEMIAEALGLKIYQSQIKESQKKIEKTNLNLREIELVRRENVPHINFLKKQVEKFEQVKQIEIELISLYKEYIKNESLYLEKEKDSLQIEKNKILSQLKNLEMGYKVFSYQQADQGKALIGEKNSESSSLKLKNLEQEFSSLSQEKNELERNLGKIEGRLEFKEPKKLSGGKCPLCGNQILASVSEENERENEKELANLKNSQVEFLKRLFEIETEEKNIQKIIADLKEEIRQNIEIEHQREQAEFNFKIKHGEFSSSLELLALKENDLFTKSETLENEIKEGVALIGSEVLTYQDFLVKEIYNEGIRLELKRKLERLKIKLEEFNLGGKEEITKEFQEASEHDQFLGKEVDDLNASLESLHKLIFDLKDKIDLEFEGGIKKINIEFQNLFSVMFNGGSAALKIFAENNKKDSIEEEAGDKEEDLSVSELGVEIDISLPHKKVKDLNALSGGERSLTAIALLFSMSQVNPAPFLVLDETDAALDEVNSRKFGDMLERLSNHSQLIIVTHNREIMSRAGILYGVTVDKTGASKLLSVKLSEAVAIAK
jgi:chromosome segregation protein